MCCSNSLRIFCNAIFPNLHRVSYFRSMEVHFLSEVSSDFTDLYPLFSGESEAVTIDFITNNNFGVNRCNLRCWSPAFDYLKNNKIVFNRVQTYATFQTHPQCHLFLPRLSGLETSNQKCRFPPLLSDASHRAPKRPKSFARRERKRVGVPRI